MFELSTINLTDKLCSNRILFDRLNIFQRLVHKSVIMIKNVDFSMKLVEVCGFCVSMLLFMNKVITALFVITRCFSTILTLPDNVFSHIRLQCSVNEY